MKAPFRMALPTPSLTILLAINAVVGALFIYAAYEAYQLSKKDMGSAAKLRPPWAEKLIQCVSGLLLLLLVAIALSFAYRYHYVA